MAWTTAGLNYLLSVCIGNTAVKARARGDNVVLGNPQTDQDLGTTTVSWGSASGGQISISPSAIINIEVGTVFDDSATVKLFQLLASDETTVLFEGSVSPNIVYETTGQLKVDATVSYSQSNTITE